ncbi:MAG TPA: hypothetical protein PKK00_11410 [Bacteroidales bacterium]|nr:hypothetical protein [Bacteroidales bacterium]
MPPYNIMELNEDDLEIVINAYNKGKLNFTINGKKYSIHNLIEIKIYTYDNKVENLDNFKKRCITNRMIGGSNSFKYYFTPACLELLGKDVTPEIIGNNEFGKLSHREESKPLNVFVDISRIEELKNISHPDYDLTKLIRFCEELNDNFFRGNYLSVVMIVRSILNHIPPIFSFNNFAEVSNNYSGGQSLKKNLNHLNNSLKNIADSYLHETIRKKEILPNATQVNFSQDLDVLLAEIVRKLNEN